MKESSDSNGGQECCSRAHQEIRSQIEFSAKATCIRLGWLRYVNQHALSSAGHQDSIGIRQVAQPPRIRRFDQLPFLVIESATDPPGTVPGEIFRPTQSNPVEFEALNLELGRSYFKF